MTWPISPTRKIFPAVATAATLLSGALPARAQMMAIPLFDQHCASCHASPAPGSRAPDRTGLAQRTPEAILEAITTGAMAANATGMNDSQKRSLAETLAGRPLGALTAGQASAMNNHCAGKPLGDPTQGPMWSGWGPDATNARFQAQPAAGLTSAQVPKLTLKWAFAFPNGTSAWGQPAVAGGRVFVGSDNGFVYSLEASSGCVYWSYEAQAGVRTAISIGPLSGSRYAIYFGDLKGNVYAVDAESGLLVWTKHPDPHPLARITGAPTLADGRLYVPLASLEEVTGSNVNYECCTFRGGLVSYDAKTGEEMWKVHTIADPAKPTKKNAQGTQLWGPAGAAVWSAPTVDLKRGAVYVGTGDAYTYPAPDTTDAVMAFDLKTGQRLWSKQVTAGDAFLVNCGGNAAGRPNCPDVSGPDVDFGNSPILRTLPDGKSVIIVGQKSGDVWAFDPDNNGAIVWQKKVGRGSTGGGLEWGSAADDQLGYFPIADAQFGAAQAGVMSALKLATGDEAWKLSPSPAANCSAGARNCVAARSAAISVIPGVVFSGTTDGVIHANATADGQLLWEYNTAHDYTTANGVAGKGGSINGPGPVISGGMLFTNSGYGYTNAAGGGNVLLAFGVDQ
jgi:polyvinyl alcohol dehydrogenase (cytochrome)